MNDVDPHLVVRAGSLYLPVVCGAAACVVRRPGRQMLIGAFLTLVWATPALLALHVIAIGAGWWRFDADGGVLLGMPVDLWLGWALLWGPVAFVALPRAPLAVVAALALLLDLLLMPLAAPVVQLGDRWLIGECAALAGCLVPSQLLGRWTAQQRHLPGRALLQVIAFSALLVWLLPAIAFESSGTNWSDVRWPSPVMVGLLAQALVVPAALGLSAVQEFVTRGGGTPIPFDPPPRIVTTGVYAYVANPMQLSGTVLLVAIGAVTQNVWVALGGGVAFAYSLGLAYWDEESDLRARFGSAWTSYRAHVRQWLPRWRPWYQDDSPIAVLYVSGACEMCREVAHWYTIRGARGLSIVAAEDHPRHSLRRITYESTDGSYQACGVEAVARAFEHLHLGWALAGWIIRLPLISSVGQLLVDASGGHPRVARSMLSNRSEDADVPSATETGTRGGDCGRGRGIPAGLPARR
jgi:protein-S-isoprenylcysteine O-methyltransferase Ste14